MQRRATLPTRLRRLTSPYPGLWNADSAEQAAHFIELVHHEQQVTEHERCAAPAVHLKIG